jgi:hypothetical protein
MAEGHLSLRKTRLRRRMDVATAIRNTGSNFNSATFPNKRNSDEILKDAAMITVRPVTCFFKAFVIAVGSWRD